MTIFLVCLGVFVALSVLFGFISIVGGALCNLTGCNKQAGPSRHATKQAEIQELLALAEQTLEEHREHVAQMQAMDVEHNRIMAERFRDDIKPLRRRLPG